MRKRLGAFGGFCVAVLLVAGFSVPASAQSKTKAPKMSNVQGTVQNVSKDNMKITVQKGTTKRDITYSADTKFMSGHSNNNKPGSVDEIKSNYFISCSGTYDKGKVDLKAQECVYRETK